MTEELNLNALGVSAEKNKVLYNFDKSDSSILEKFKTCSTEI